MAEETAQLRAALEAAKSENELLLEQITRLCCHIEQTSGGAVDPIEVMHGRAPPEIKTTPPATPASSWIRGLLSRTGIVDDGGAGSRNGASRAMPAAAISSPQNTPLNAYASPSRAPPPLSHVGSTPEGGGSGNDGDGDGDDYPPLVAGGVAGATFEWRGDPEAIAELERKLSESQFIAEATLDGSGFTRLPSSPAMWAHLARTLTSLSLNSNGLVEVPSSMANLRHLRKLRIEGNLLRELPPPVLQLTRLEELGLACNQLTGLPEGISSLSSLTELWLVSNEISYLPQSIGALTRLRKLELSANALHELPRSIGKLTELTHLWLGGNELPTFPQQICALDRLEVLDVHGNQLTSIPRVVGTMPSLKTLLLQGNPLSFPPLGVVSQGPTAVIEYLREHRQSDLMSGDAERSLKAVQAYKSRLANSIDAQEEYLQRGGGGGGGQGAASAAAAPPPPPLESAPPPVGSFAARLALEGAEAADVGDGGLAEEPANEQQWTSPTRSAALPAPLTPSVTSSAASSPQSAPGSSSASGAQRLKPRYPERPKKSSFFD